MTEDFITFEIAKKLKEKGFKEKCLAYYDVEDNVGLLYNTQYSDEALPCQYTDLLQCHNTGEAETQSDDSENCVDAPTISQALKWLREEKNLCVEVLISVRGGWYNIIYEIAPRRGFDLKHMLIEAKSYEDAAIAGIEYCVDNII